MNDEESIHHILEEVVTLPSLPTMVAKVTELVDDPNCPLSEIGKALSQDPSLALKTLRLVNSAFYGVREKVSSVEQAVPLLGAKVIKNLVYSAAVFDTLHEGEEDLLRHSVSCGVVMRCLLESGAAPGASMIKPEEGFIMGLLHDVGKIIIHQYMADGFQKVAAMSLEKKCPWVEAEREVLRIDHAVIGASLARQWKLSDILADAISGHHDLSRCTDDTGHVGAALLAVADYICYASGVGGQNDIAPHLDPEVWKLTGITSTTICSVLEGYFSHILDVDQFLNPAA